MLKSLELCSQMSLHTYHYVYVILYHYMSLKIIVSLCLIMNHYNHMSLYIYICIIVIYYHIYIQHYMSLLLLVGCCWHIWHCFQFLPSLIPANRVLPEVHLKRFRHLLLQRIKSWRTGSTGERPQLWDIPTSLMELYGWDIYIYILLVYI